MGVFSRLGDIIHANVNALLDKAEDPQKIARLMIQEMEDTLVEVRTAAARSIAERKHLTRRLEDFEASAQEWHEKAELALQKNREDLARGALAARKKAQSQAEALQKEIKRVEESVHQADEDMVKLQTKLDEARARHKALMLRQKTAHNRVRMREHMQYSRVDEALNRYDLIERKVEGLEAKADSFDLGGQPLNEALLNLETDEDVEKELSALKERVKGKPASSTPKEEIPV